MYPHFKDQYQQQMLLPIKYCALTVLIFTTHTFLYGRVYVLLPEESADDLGSCLPLGMQTLHCQWPVTNVLQLKTHLADVQSCFLHIR